MIDSNHLPIFNSLHTYCLATNHISSPSHHHLRYSSTICMRDDEMNGLELPYISLPGVIPKVTCNHRWRRDLLPFFSSLRTQPPTFPPLSSQWVITLKRARQHLLPLLEDFQFCCAQISSHLLSQCGFKRPGETLLVVPFL